MLPVIWITVLSFGPGLACGPASGAADEKVFEKDILPILEGHCLGCHSRDERKGRLDLSTFEALSQGGKSGEVVVPGKGGESILLDRVTRTDGKVMPPPRDGKRLSAEEVATIRAWIDGGARSVPGSAPPARKRPPASPSPAAEKVDEGPPAPVTSIAFSPGGKVLAIGRDGGVSVAETTLGETLSTLEGPGGAVRSLAWRKDGERLAAGGGLPYREGDARVWIRDGWKEAGRIRGHKDAIYAIAFSPDGSVIATASYDKLVKLWDAATLAEKATLKDHIDAVFSLAYSPDGSRLFSVSADRGVKAWDAAAGKRLFTLSDATQGLLSVAVSPVRSEVAAAGQDRMIRVWKVEGEGGALLKSAFAHEAAVERIAYSPDGKVLFSAAEDGALKAWDAETLAELRVFERQPDWPLDLSVRPDGSAIAVGRYDGSWAVYDAATAAKLLEVGGRKPKQPGAGAAKPAVTTSSAPRKRKRSDLLVDVVDAGNVTVPPSLGGHWPRSVARGTKTTLSIDGRNLEGAEIRFYEAGLSARVIKNEAQPKPKFQRDLGSTAAQVVDLSVPHKLQVEVEVAADALPGMHRFLALTPAGATNALSLHVEALPEARESEPNDDTQHATDMGPVQGLASRVFLGSMDRSGDADFFRFEAAAGDEVVFHILSQSLGSSLNALLEILDTDGKTLARSTEPRFGSLSEARVAQRFEKGGPCYLKLTDRSFGSGGFYRLYAGRLPFVTSFFPPGLERGTSREIAVEGFNLGERSRVKVEAPADAAWGASVPLPIPGAIQGGSAAVGDSPEALEAEPNDTPGAAQRVVAPVTVNGVVDGLVNGGGAGEDDCFAFEAKAGESWIVDVVASRIGSRLDSTLEVLDAKGRPIERAALRCVAQTFLTLSDRDSRTQGLRLDAWSDLRINDLVMVGREVLKVLLLPDYPDEDVTFFGQSGVRVGFFDTTPEFHAVGAPIYKVEAHPPGREFPPNGMPVFRLQYRNDDGGAPVHGKDSRIHFTAPGDGTYVVRLRDAQGRGGPSFYYRLQVRKPRPDFQLFAGAENINVPRGGGVPFEVSVSRLDDMDERIDIDLVDPLPAGFRLETSPILPGQSSATLVVHAGEEAASTPIDRVFRLRARAAAAGRELVREASIRMLRVAGPPDMSLVMEPGEVHLTPGGTAPVKVTARRRNGFAGRIPLDVPNLPPGVIVMDTGLNGILIPEQEDERTYVLHAEPWVKPQRRRVYTVGRTETSSPMPTQFTTEPAVLVIEPAPGITQKLQ